jgi:hypothetical protein
MLWILAWIGVAVWSLFAWGAYGLLDLFGGFAARNADVVTNHPETVEWLSWALMTLRSLGLGAILFVWGLVSLLILAVPAVLSFVLSRPDAEPRHPDWRMQNQGPGTQGSNTVDGFPPVPGGPVRRIERR